MRYDAIMVTTASSAKCPRCGAAVDPGLASGVCHACLLRAVALGTAADSLPAVPWVPPAVSELAAAFPQLEIVELIGHGGMGAVYKARQKSLGRWVALKILAPQHASKADFAERFSREAKVLAEVNHPHIVTVHDFGQAGEFYFLLMEFVDGVSLRQAMRAGRFTPEQALSIVPPICEALQFAHEHGIVHRDIKPENLLLDKEGRVKIADFGIARMMRAGGETSSLPSPSGRGAGAEGAPPAGIDLTQESILGTPRYMAPEQRERPASVDHRADIYSLGVVLYEMLTGELPGPSWQPPSRKSPVDARLDQIVLRALEQNPDLRYQSATELRTQVETAVSNCPPEFAETLLEATRPAEPRQANLEILANALGMRSKWSRLFLAISFLGCLGSLAFVPGLGRMAGFSGFFGFVGVATIAELFTRLRHRLRSRRLLWGGLAIVAIVLVGLTNFILSRTNIHAEVTVYDAEVQGSSFTFQYEVECPPDWRAWLVLENSQAAKVANPAPGTPGPTPLTRYQVPLGEGGRARVPLEYLPMTDEGISRMKASIGPPRQSFTLLPKRQSVILSYQTEGFVKTHAVVWLLHESESPDSLTRRYGGPAFVTIAPPSRPKLGPFEAAFEQGRIELVQLNTHPAGTQPWKANGDLSTEQGLPERGGKSWSSGHVMRELTLRISQTEWTCSSPVLRFPDKSSFGSMGRSIYSNRNNGSVPPTSLVTCVIPIACPPEAKEMTLEVGIADGNWKTKISFDRHQNQRQFDHSSHQTPDGDWAGKVQIADPVAERYPVSFSYSDRDDYETRLVYELPDGKLVPLRDNGGQGNMRTGLTTMPVSEVDSITKFHVQARRYQWTEFRNVSLELGHKTEVEIQDAY